MWKATLLLMLPALFCTGSADAAPHTEGFGLSQSRHAYQDKMLDRRFAVREGGQLAVRVGDSDVEIVSGASDEVHVEVFVESNDRDRARAHFENQHFRVTQEGNTVRVVTRQDQPTRFSWRNWRDHPRILTRLHVPTRFNADLRTSDGDVQVERLRGEIFLKTSDGDIEVGALAGTEIVLNTSDGDIRVETLEAQTLDIETSDGDLDLGTVVARRIHARTSDGDIRIHRLDGEAEVRTSDGDIRLDAYHGPTLVARTSDGDITIDELIAGQSRIRSSEGTIVLRRVEGALEASGSDTDIRVTLFKPGKVLLTTSDGDITIDASKKLPATIHLHGEEVRLSSQFQLDGEVGEETAHGHLNGGGPRLEARTSDGTVTLRAR